MTKLLCEIKLRKDMDADQESHKLRWNCKHIPSLPVKLMCKTVFFMDDIEKIEKAWEVCNSSSSRANNIFMEGPCT